jgi:ankyrin repeat protein
MFAVGSPTKSREVIDELLDWDADLNASNDDGWTALLLAMANRDWGSVGALLLAGAQTDPPEKRGVFTPLVLAAAEGNIHIVDALLISGADLNAKTKAGFTALMVAALGGYTEIMRVLLEEGANANAQNDQGETALLLAAAGEAGEFPDGVQIEIYNRRSGHRFLWGIAPKARTVNLEAAQGQAVRLLLSAGADVNLKDERGRTALTRAKQANRAEIVKLLVEAGSR